MKAGLGLQKRYKECVVAILLLLSFYPGVSFAAGTLNKLQRPPNNVGLVGYWTFDGNDMPGGTVNDISGEGNHGNMSNMATSTSRVAGKIGQALKFDGGDDSIDISGALQSSLPFTFSAWVKTNNAGVNAILIQGNNANDTKVGIEVNGTNAHLRYQGTSSNENFAGTSVINDSEWHHIVGVFKSASDRELFVDGVSEATNTNTLALPTFNNLNIGFQEDQSPGNYFDGSIDDVRIYNRALSAGEIARMYNAGATSLGVSKRANKGSLQNGLVGHWTFDGKDMPLGTVRDVSSQGNHGSMVDMATSTSRIAGKVGQGIKFDGIDDYINIPDGDTLDGFTNTTVALWINPSSLSGSQQLVNKYEPTGDQRSYTLVFENSGIIRWAFSNDGTSGTFGDWDTDSTVITSTGTWYHVVITHQDAANNVDIYINGSEVASTLKTGSVTSIHSGTAELSLGIYKPTLVNPFNGYMDDVRIYNRALSSEEVRRLYEIGVSEKVSITPQRRVTEGLVGHWTFDGKDMPGGTVNDISGEGNHGSMKGMATSTSRVAGVLGQGLYFDGGDDYIDAGDPTTTDGLEQFSVSAWVSIDTNLSLMIASRYETTDLSNSAFYFSTIVGTSNLRLRMLVPASNGNFVHWTSDDEVLSIGSMAHVVAVVDVASDTATLYVDGSAVTAPKADSGTGGPSALNTVSTPLLIGGRLSSGALDLPWEGEIDDVRMYGRLLSADEIQALYNLGR